MPAGISRFIISVLALYGANSPRGIHRWLDRRGTSPFQVLAALGTPWCSRRPARLRGVFLRPQYLAFLGQSHPELARRFVRRCGKAAVEERWKASRPEAVPILDRNSTASWTCSTSAPAATRRRRWRCPGCCRSTT